MTSKNHKIKLETFKDKSTLVKLLAEEDLSVIYQKVPTASFNVKTREVTLPIWKDKSEDVMDMMSLHEVGHALYTPEDMMKKGEKKNIKHSFLNVLEDVRIEKMIQDKYLGSVKVFKKAYKELIEKDFFNIKDKDLSKLNLIDRINMHYKNVPNVPFDDDELEWVEKANKTKTPNDVVKLAYQLQKWMYGQNKDVDSDSMFDLLDLNTDDLEKSPDDNNDDNSDKDNNSESSESENQELENQESEDKKDEDSKDSEDDKTDNKENSDDKSEEKKEEGLYRKGTGHDDDDIDGIRAITDDNYQRKQIEAFDSDATEICHLNIPKINLDEAIVDYKQVNKELSEHYLNSVKHDKDNANYMDWIKHDIKKYQKDQSKTISYMVKEFEMKKAADLYKRATISKTGSLNMDKLHSYSYNEDLFLKMTTLPGATNHGLVMFVDWSGSMSDNFHNTLKQTINLVLFCKRVNIPFEVYGFTNGYGKRDDTNKNIKVQKQKQNDLIVNECTLLNVLSSRANKNEFEVGLINLWAMSNYWNDRTNMTNKKWNEKYIYPIYIPSNYQLHSTPLNHSIVYAMDLVPKFKKDNGIDKVHTVFLTDGSSNNIGRKYEWHEYNDLDKTYATEETIKEMKKAGGEFRHKGFDVHGTNVILKDPITNKRYVTTESPHRNRYSEWSFSYEKQTDILISFLKARVPNMSVTNFFIAGRNSKGTISKSDVGYVFGLSSWQEEDMTKIKEIQKEIKKNNVAVCTTKAWDEMYVLPGGTRLDTTNDDLSEVKPGAKKAELKKAFSKMTSGRKNNRPLLSKFIGMIA